MGALFGCFALPKPTRFSRREKYLFPFPSYFMEIQKDTNSKGKLLCLFFFAHCLRNAEHHLNAAKTQAVSLQKQLAQTWQDTQPASEDKTLATAYVRSFWACVDKLRRLHDPPSGSTCLRKTWLAAGSYRKGSFCNKNTKRFVILTKKTAKEISGSIWIQTMIHWILDAQPDLQIPSIIETEYDANGGITSISACPFTNIHLAKLSKCYHRSVTVDYLAWLANMRWAGIPSKFQYQNPTPLL